MYIMEQIEYVKYYDDYYNDNNETLRQMNKSVKTLNEFKLNLIEYEIELNICLRYLSYLSKLPNNIEIDKEFYKLSNYYDDLEYDIKQYKRYIKRSSNNFGNKWAKAFENRYGIYPTS